MLIADHRLWHAATTFQIDGGYVIATVNPLLTDAVADPKAPERMSEDQIAMIVEGLGGLLDLLRNADPRDKAEIYSRLGLQLTYKPGTETLIAEVVASPAIDGVNNVCPRRDARDIHTVIASREIELCLRG